ncbi:SPX domain-containing protein [Tieghemostelium lacteum]|uniref:SPX domain-containing protein n=1 Tax=Tieghemostelium lacteum TaxID=361077 RepID=A0A151ZGV5_TIELA|nr:SPX domain-containing protein [Tieghemostelium lacteum]|eukprot:KYQ93139.1 SPX domain-containing protein [Tieghemostelium lacteum]
MKFGKILEQQQIPEWRDKYVNYKFLRKTIKRVKLDIEKLNINLKSRELVSELPHDVVIVQSQALSRSSPSVSRGSPSLRTSFSNVSLRTLLQNHNDQVDYESLDNNNNNNNSNSNNNNSQQIVGDGVSHLDDLQNSMQSLKGIQDEILQVFVDEMNKVNDFYQQRENEAIERFNKIKEQIPLYVQSKLKKSHKPQNMDSNSNSNSNSINNNSGGHSIIIGTPVDQFNIEMNLLGASNVDSENEDEPQMSVTNGGGDEDFDQCGDGAGNTSSGEDNGQNIELHDQIEMKNYGVKFLGTLKSIKKLKEILPFNPGEVIEQNAKKLLSLGKKTNEEIMKEAMKEFYHYLIILKNYQVINYTAFVKILKKAEKNTHLLLASKILDQIESLPLRTSKKVEKISKSLENLYSELFSRSKSLRDARKQLRNTERSSTNPNTSSFFTGVCTGWCTAILILIYYFIYSGEQTDFTRFSVVYNLYSALGLVLLWTVMFGLDVMIWTKFHVHYSFIFEISANKLNHFKIFQAVTLLSVLWVTSIGVYMWTSVDAPFPFTIPPEFQPLILLGVYICLLIFPWNQFQLSTRKWFLQTIYRIVSAPKNSVRFKDFFMGDQLSSLVLMMVLSTQFVCFYAVDVWEEEGEAVCPSKARYINPFISGLPAWWRFVQCLRRYYDSRDKVHLKNALKYSLSIIVVFFSTMDSFYSTNGWRSPLRITWLIFGVCNSSYSYYWDIFHDWTILTLRPGVSPTFLNKISPWKYQIRKKRMYPHVFVYYLAIISNLGFRFTWTFTKSLPQLIHFLPSYKLVVVIAIIEVMRRFQWNIYRLENEHLNNCGKFRVIREIPLPFNNLN